MSLISGIEWTQATWNPTLGCSKISPGCKGCYAIKDVHRMAGNPNPKVKAANAGLTILQNGRLNWTGEVRFLPDRLNLPLRTKKPTTFFVNSLSDLFHPKLAAKNIAEVFKVMYRANWHTFQVLTKHGEVEERLVEITNRVVASFGPMPRHIWLGVSVEDRQHVSRIELLRRTPAAVRFLSIEPLLEDLGVISPLLARTCTHCGGSHRGRPQENPCSWCEENGYGQRATTGIDWVIVGGESGPGARPMHPEWVRSIQAQCRAANVSFFFKQWGAWTVRLPGFPNKGPMMRLTRAGRNGQDLSHAEDGGDVWMQRMGKKRSGRSFDGRTWDEMPEVRA